MPAISYNTVSARDVQMLFDSTQKHADTVWLMAFSGTLVFIAITVRVLIVRLEARSFTVSDWLMIISLVRSIFAPLHIFFGTEFASSFLL